MSMDVGVSAEERPIDGVILEANPFVGVIVVSAVAVIAEDAARAADKSEFVVSADDGAAG